MICDNCLGDCTNCPISTGDFAEADRTTEILMNFNRSRRKQTGTNKVKAYLAFERKRYEGMLETSKVGAK